MGPLSALLVAASLFGLELAPPNFAELSLVPSAGDASETSPQWKPDPLEPSAEPAVYATELRRRANLTKAHRAFGIATWAAVLVATITGTIQYRNLYGAPFTTDLAHTPCVTGGATFGQDQCYGPPLPHAIPGFIAGGLYFTTLSLAIAMPDPDHASEGNSKYARTLRTHKALRWVHLAGMVTQIVLGVLIANPGFSGLDRANDYGALKALAGMHLVSGYVTLGALTWAGAIMLF